MFRDKDKYIDDDFVKDMAKDLKKKAIRKYLLIALAVIIAVSVVIGLNIEGKDSKLPGGKGELITNSQSVDNLDVNDNKTDVDSANKDSNDNETGDNKTSDNKTVVGDKTPSSNKNTTSDKNNTSDKTSTSNKPNTSTGKKPTPEESKVDNSKDPTASNDGNVALKPDKAETVTVTISIKCTTLSSDMSKLTDPSVAPYIPANGVILAPTTFTCTTDNTVFDVLNAVCRNNGIHLDFKYTPLYESYYVKGINYLYEFDGGSLSGWMYKVNGWFPNYGCSSYYLSDGEVIEWVYTCDCGKDVGDQYWDTHQ